MAQTVCVIVNGLDIERLEAIASGRNQLQKHVRRPQVVLASAQGDPVQHVAALLGVSGPMVWRWQRRFADEGVDGLLHPSRPSEAYSEGVVGRTHTAKYAVRCQQVPTGLR